MALYPLWMEGLSPEMVKISEEELGENDQLKVTSLDELRKHVNEEPDWEIITDDIFLLRFLRLKKFDAKSAFKILKNYYSYKAKHFGIVSDLTPNEFEQILELNKFIIAPSRDSKGSGVIYMSLGSLDVQVCTIEKVTAAILTALDVALCIEATQICGMSFIVDFAGMGWRLLGHMFRPSYLIAAIQAIIDTWPCRIQGFQIVNELPYYKTMHNTFVKPLMPAKLNDRINFYGNNYAELHQKFPLECLPSSIGGKLIDEDYKEFRIQMMSRRDLIIRLNTYVFKGKSYPLDIKTQ